MIGPERHILAAPVSTDQSFRGPGSLTETKQKARGKSGQGVTSQHDRRVIYKHRRMPTYKKKTWRKFVKRVRAVTGAQLGIRSIVKNSAALAQTANGAFSNDQVYTTCCLYGLRGASGTPLVDTPNGYSDLKQIVSNDTTIPITGKVMFTSGILDVTYTNETQEIISVPVGEGETQQIRESVPIELDIYEVWMYKDKHGYYDIDSAIADASNTTPAIAGAGYSTLELTDRGATPWDFPQAIQNLGMKIIKKTKFFLGYRQSCTYQIRDPRNHIIDVMQLRDDSFSNSFAWKKVTKGLIAVARKVPNSSAVGVSLQVGMTRKYSYRLLEQNGDKHAYAQ